MEFNDTLCTLTYTDTATVAVRDISTVCTVIVVDPEPTPVMTPELDTVATDGLADVHVTALLAALVGKTVAVMARVIPVPMDILVGETDTEETGTVMDTTHVAVNELQRAVITTVPSEMAVITPDPFTVAFAELEDHDTVLFVAFDGKTVATNVNVFPTCMMAVV